MSVDEARRLFLHDTAREHWNAEAALILMEMLPPSGWGDVATRQQLEALEERTILRFAAVDLRLDAMDRRFDAVDQRFEAVDRQFAAVDRRFAAADDRMEGMESRLSSELRAGLADMHRKTVVWTVGTMIALTGAVTTAVTAIAHLT